jgi:hypothetical protein
MPSHIRANDYFGVFSPSTAGPAVGTIAAAPVVTAASAIATITAIARVAAITTAPAIGVVVTAPAVVAAIISGITLRAIATIAPISINGACQGPHDQHCEKSGEHDTLSGLFGRPHRGHTCPCPGIRQAFDRKLVNAARRSAPLRLRSPNRTPKRTRRKRPTTASMGQRRSTTNGHARNGGGVHR